MQLAGDGRPRQWGLELARPHSMKHPGSNTEHSPQPPLRARADARPAARSYTRAEDRHSGADSSTDETGRRLDTSPRSPCSRDPHCHSAGTARSSDSRWCDVTPKRKDWAKTRHAKQERERDPFHRTSQEQAENSPSKGSRAQGAQAGDEHPLSGRVPAHQESRGASAPTNVLYGQPINSASLS